MAIDLTDRFFAAAYMRGGTERWTLDRARTPYRAIALHHAAGWYGAPLDADAAREREEEQIERLARDHAQRFGIGPGYNYLAFPSGRLYAVGKVSTHRAHTKGRNPDTGTRWNVEGIAICALGDYERAGRDAPTAGLRAAIAEAAAEIRAFPFTLDGAPVYGHGAIPTANAAGAPLPQATSCPGRRLLPLAAELNGAQEAASSAPPPGFAAELAAIRAAADAIERKAAAR